jgi:fatty acid desaturase
MDRAVSEDAAAAPEAGSLTGRCDTTGLKQLAVHLGVLLLTGYLVSTSRATGWWLFALVVHGFVLVFLFAPLHETVHRTPFRSRWMNTVVSWISGVLLVLPPAYFRAFHFAHHRHTQDPDRDPELTCPKPTSWRSWLWTVSGIPYWHERVTTTLRHAMGRVREPFIGVNAKAGIIREARILLAVYALIAVSALVAQSSAPLEYWLLPAMLGQPFLRMYLLAEHTGCPLVADMRANSRTTLTNLAMQRLAWNMPFHTAHHMFPGIPFHALPEAHRRIRDQVRYEARGYLSVQRELIRRLRAGV